MLDSSPQKWPLHAASAIGLKPLVRQALIRPFGVPFFDSVDLPSCGVVGESVHYCGRVATFPEGASAGPRPTVRVRLRDYLRQNEEAGVARSIPGRLLMLR